MAVTGLSAVIGGPESSGAAQEASQTDAKNMRTYGFELGTFRLAFGLPTTTLQARDVSADTGNSTSIVKTSMKKEAGGN